MLEQQGASLPQGCVKVHSVPAVKSGWLAQLDRVSAYEAPGHRFESYITHHTASYPRGLRGLFAKQVDPETGA